MCVDVCLLFLLSQCGTQGFCKMVSWDSGCSRRIQPGAGQPAFGTNVLLHHRSAKSHDVQLRRTEMHGLRNDPRLGSVRLAIVVVFSSHLTK